MSRIRATVTLSLLFCCLSCSPQDTASVNASSPTIDAPAPVATDWPAWRGVNRDGKSPDTGLLKEWPEGGPGLIWSAHDIGIGYSNVAVARNKVYTTGGVDGKLVIFAFDHTGQLKGKQIVDDLWTKSFEGSRATPTIDDDRLYLLGGNGRIVCLNADTAKGIWARHAKDFGGSPGGWGYAESVLIDGDLAIFKPGGKNCIVALNKMTGRTVWTSSGFSAGPEYSSCKAIEFQGRRLIVTGTREGLVCVSAKDGSLQWYNKWSAGNTANCPTPDYADGHVFWANGYGAGGVCVKLRLDGNKVAGDEVWTTKNMDCHHGGTIIHEGRIYGNNGGGWACLDLATGDVLWDERGVGKGSLCFADGMLYLFSENRGEAGLAVCSPDGLEMRGRFRVDGDGKSWAHPVVIGGRLYLRYGTNLYCFDVAAK